MTETPDQTRRAWTIRAVGVLLYGLIAYLVMFFWNYLAAYQLQWTSLIFFPLSFGIGGQLLLDPLRAYPVRRVFVGTIYVMLALTALLLVFAFETIICVVIAAPFMLLGSYLGIWLTRWIMGLFGPSTPTTLNASLLLLPLVLSVPEDWLGGQPDSYSVTSEVIVDAPPAVIWAHLFNVPTIQEDERIFTVSHTLLGAPRAVRAEMGEGARTAHWEGGITFDEILTDVVDERLVAWDFDFTAFGDAAPEMHIHPRNASMNVLRGRYALEPVADGATRLTLTTDYTLTTPFNSYVALWGWLFLDDFQSSVLHVLKTRAEAAL